VPTPRIPSTLLLACGPLGRMDATHTARLLAQALDAAGRPRSDELALSSWEARDGDARELLERERFDARMLSSRALVVVMALLDPITLAGSLTFEMATRARQSGVPCYAIAGESRLSAFDARLLDQQLVLQARGEATLRRAAIELARVV
jgi:hypothetical protein